MRNLPEKRRRLPPNERSGANFFGVRARGKRIFCGRKKTLEAHQPSHIAGGSGRRRLYGAGALLQYILSDMTTASALEEMEFRVEEYGDAIRGVLRSNAQTLETLSPFVRAWEGMEAQDVAAELARALEKSDFDGMAWFPSPKAPASSFPRDGVSFDHGFARTTFAHDAQTSIERALAGRRWFPASTKAAWCCPRASGSLYAAPVRSHERIVGAWPRWTTPTCSPAWSTISTRTARAVFCILSTRRAISSCARKKQTKTGAMENIFDASVLTEEEDDVRAVLARGESVSFSFAYAGGGVPRRFPAHRRVRLV